ncbi:hypothetical protein [Methylobacterium sp. CM6246]
MFQSDFDRVSDLGKIGSGVGESFDSVAALVSAIQSLHVAKVLPL